MIRLIFTDFGRKRPDKRRIFVTQISRCSRSIYAAKICEDQFNP